MSAQPTPAKSKTTLILAIVAVLVLAAAAGGGWFWWSGQAQAGEGEDAAAAAKAPALYYAMEPAFVVNLVDADVVRYLQADVQLMTRDADTAAALEAHAPAVRNKLLLLFGQQSATRLAQRAAKEQLQKQALAEVQNVLKAESAPARVEAVYFTSLVTQ